MSEVEEMRDLDMKEPGLGKATLAMELPSSQRGGCSTLGASQDIELKRLTARLTA